ncbi:MAG: hypothetical protein II039_05760, partial [Treponema sp.]|nr:hypothetical protein [Treponema sp.]
EVPNKIEKAGFTVEKSSFVDAPVIKELPMTLECKLIKFDDNGNNILSACIRQHGFFFRKNPA